MASHLFPLLDRFTKDAWVDLEAAQITPWAFFNTTHGVRVPRFGGGEIAVGGDLEFSGSPRDLFWGRYIEPFLEDIAIRAMEEARRLATDRNQNPREPLIEAAGLAASVARKAFRRMMDIDRRLRGKGYPQSILPKNTSAELAAVEQFIDRHLKAELAMLPAKPTVWRRVEQFHQSHQALYWYAGILITVALGVWAIAVSK